MAIDADQQLAVIELKNVEDRYVIQQLTRYYDAFKQEQSFQIEVDWERPIRRQYSIGLAFPEGILRYVSHGWPHRLNCDLSQG